jgi:hypothetical protein
MTETVDSEDAGYATSIAVDSWDKVHISYVGWDGTNSLLKYATNASGDWVITTVDVGSSSSIALDSSGKAHISYYDNTNSGLKYATNRDGEYVGVANAEASMYGRQALIASGSFNALALLLIPAGAVIVLKIARRKK